MRVGLKYTELLATLRVVLLVLCVGLHVPAVGVPAPHASPDKEPGQLEHGAAGAGEPHSPIHLHWATACRSLCSCNIDMVDSQPDCTWCAGMLQLAASLLALSGCTACRISA